jgi:hypothetical protein
MAARKILAAINFTQRYEKLRPFDVRMQSEVTGKTKNNNNLFIFKRAFYHPASPVFCPPFLPDLRYG